ncbi:Na+/H+ antiporter NhaC family protein [Corallincola luteus]|uniref:Na+/H+ antiporter NhaC family protein n=1 Tax=Corallincola luteus TaxID=1775177 RepID=A0ABY2ARI3_9GAMM|nr:Na+/H+ antiporter NhaC family protein [Corallincola luteus]TCI05657.1 Na+/H+ antiporter NhaC family protein [Corallincola luteus]
MTSIDNQIRPNASALLPILLFLVTFIGTGIYYQTQGVDYAFYQLPSPVAVLPALLLAIVMHKEGLNRAIDTFLSGAGHSNIMAMCFIYLLAGAFATVAKATGGVDATVNMGLTVIPSSFILPGIFLISAFIATAMGTSMGTIGAVAPIALGIAEAAGIDKALMAGVVLSGAMFGDNLSIISDTTIAATRTQGCEMKDKFRENIFIAAPAALIVIVLFFFLQTPAPTPDAGHIEWFKVLPYLTILVLAVLGMNVFLVLAIGLILAGGVGLAQVPDYSMSQYTKDIYAGFGSMQEIFILSIMIGGLGAMVKAQGGLAWMGLQIEKLIALFSRSHTEEANERAAELGIAGIATLTNTCTANNTVSIIVSGDLAKELAEKHEVTPKRSASLLDIFACVCQGLLPYGAQALLLGSIFLISPIEVSAHSYYVMILAVTGIAAVFIKHQLRQNAKR